MRGKTDLKNGQIFNGQPKLDLEQKFNYLSQLGRKVNWKFYLKLMLYIKRSNQGLTIIDFLKKVPIQHGSSV